MATKTTSLNIFYSDKHETNILDDTATVILKTMIQNYIFWAYCDINLHCFCIFCICLFISWKLWHSRTYKQKNIKIEFKMLYLFSIDIRRNWYTQTHSNNWAMNFMFQNLFIFKIDKWYTWWWNIKVKDRIPQSAKSNVRFTSVDGSMTSDKFRACKSSMYVPQDRYTDLIWLQTGSWKFIFESFFFFFFFLINS
jgi:hypothetical protein